MPRYSRLGRVERIRGAPDVLSAVEHPVPRYSRFGRVERIRGVPDVLSAVEHPERQPGEEVSRRQVAGHWAEAEPGLT